MKLFPLAAMLAMLTALPAAAQSVPLVADAFDQGDWWGLDITGEGVGSGDSVMLVNGEAVRSGDQAELQVFIVYRQPKGDGATGRRSTVTVDCTGKTQTVVPRNIFYPDAKMRELSSAGTGAQPILPASALYRFACASNRRYATHYGAGSRDRTAASLFGRYNH